MLTRRAWPRAVAALAHSGHGRKVNQAKGPIRQRMIDDGEAVVYSEPESEVISRSNDVCIVALMDQWYLDYGEPSWREQAKKYEPGMPPTQTTVSG